MPSASNKLEKQASLELGEPFKQALTVIEKKTRNLEKRKARLDVLKTQATELHDQQKEALNRYEEVVNTLEFSKDLAKQLTQISQEAAKAQKKQAKRELIEHQARETQKLREVLMINNVLSTMCDEKIRDDFLNGRNGAMTLTEESLKRLDSLFKMVTPSREVEEDAPSYELQLVSGSEHLFALVEGKKKDVLGTSYQALRELIFNIHECAYFKKPEEKEEEPAAPVNGDHSGSEIEQVAVVEEPEEKSTEQPVETVVADDDKIEDVQSEDAVPEARSIQAEDNSVFSTFTHAKPYGDVFTNSPGSFNFLQESQIDPDSPHMDPAVVAAHPMVPPSNRQQPYPNPSQPNELVSPQYANQPVNDAQHVLSSTTTAVPQQAPAGHYLQAVQPLAGGPLQEFGQIPTQTYTNQHYVAMPAFAAPIYSPVPTQAVAQNAIITNDDNNWMADNKKHYMNVNATAFESRSFDSNEDNGAIREDQNSNNDLQSQQQCDNQSKFSSDSQGYQSGSKNNFQSRGGYGNYRGNGGPRGGSSGRGGPRGGGSGAVNNGNNGRGNRQSGGGYANNGTRGGAGGGGSGNYQGYREGGYNYQRDNYNGSGGYGSNGAQRRGGANSNQRGNRGELNSRGGSRGGYAKTSAGNH